ncbi:putative secondary metabolism biosynthetic enzyme [Sporothrix curviconia]|uniref:Secondary metabolism biosynthetic enzyme n=1 Tax=Sporothrix curviconia TaxID=1260050 RepID=A0ABP0BCF5_9PEZI
MMISTETPSEQTALVCAGTGEYRLAHDVQVASPPPPGMVLCAVKAVALNPADWKMIDFSATAEFVGGHEFAGEVVQVGAGVEGFAVGDCVLAPVPGLFGATIDDTNTKSEIGRVKAGAFCEYVPVAADMVVRLPSDMNLTDAAGLSVVTYAAGLALYQTLQLPLPEVDGGKAAAAAAAVSRKPTKPTYVLVSGGASASGTIAIQLLKASGLTPIATCSPENHEMLLALGAVETFDYHSPSCGMEIRNYTQNTLAHVLDCVTQAESMKLSYEAIGPQGGRYVALDPFPTRIQYTRRDIRADWVMGPTLFGEPVKLAGTYGRPARPQDRLFTSRFFGHIEKMLAAGTLKPHPVELRTGGLSAVPQGIEDLRMGRVRARKLVYPVA